MLPRVKFLLVDNLEENLLALSALLRREDVEILQARSGPEALELLLVHDVALAFLDVQMPDMDGFELAELMRGAERTHNVPIIFVTAGSRDQQRLFKGYETGAVDFLYKPIDPHLLKSKAAVFFQLYRQKQELARQLQKSTETLRLNEMFMAVLGHDLRNPLHAILMSSDFLLHRSDDEAVRETAARIQGSGRRMGRMIADMLDLARTRLAGGIPLKKEPADLGVLVQRSVQEAQAAFPGRRIEVLREGDLSGEWDADRLSQAAGNLIGNAIQHGERGEAIQVRLDGTRAEVVSFTVANAGVIKPEILSRLFDPFRGGQRQPGQSAGLGLGLYIVQQIVEAHHGSIKGPAGSSTNTVFLVAVPRRVAGATLSAGGPGGGGLEPEMRPRPIEAAMPLIGIN